MKLMTMISVALLSFFGFEAEIQQFKKEIKANIVEQEKLRKREGLPYDFNAIKISFDLEELSPDKLLYLAKAHHWRLDFPNDTARLKAFEQAARKAEQMCDTHSVYCDEEVSFKALVHKKKHMGNLFISGLIQKAWKNVSLEDEKRYEALYEKDQKWKKLKEYLDLIEDSIKPEARQAVERARQDITQKNNLAWYDSSKWESARKLIERKRQDYLQKESQKDIVEAFFRYFPDSTMFAGNKLPPFTWVLPEPVSD